MLFAHWRKRLNQICKYYNALLVILAQGIIYTMLRSCLTSNHSSHMGLYWLPAQLDTVSFISANCCFKSLC